MGKFLVANIEKVDIRGYCLHSGRQHRVSANEDSVFFGNTADREAGQFSGGVHVDVEAFLDELIVEHLVLDSICRGIVQFFFW